MKIIAHQSGPRKYPAQTIMSAKLALEEGADVVEIDARLTADGNIAISHNDNAMWPFGVNKNISDMTTDEFLSMRHKDAREFPAHLLQDYIDCEIAPLLIHVKQGGAKLVKILNFIHQSGYDDKVIYGVCCLEDLNIVKKYNSNLKILAFIPNEFSIEEFASAGADYIRLWEPWITEERIKLIKSFKKEVWIMAGWFENGMRTGYTEPKNIKQWIGLGIDGVLLNDIQIVNE